MPLNGAQPRNTDDARSSREAVILVLGTLALALAALIFAACREDPRPFLSTAIHGDQGVVRAFSGKWYVHGTILARVVPGEPGLLHVRLLSDFSLSLAETRGSEIYFEFTEGGKVFPRSLRLIEPDLAVLLPPGVEPSWCATCTPYLVRTRWPWWVHTVRRRAERFVESAYDRVMDRLIEVV